LPDTARHRPHAHEQHRHDHIAVVADRLWVDPLAEDQDSRRTDSAHRHQHQHARPVRGRRRVVEVRDPPGNLIAQRFTECLLAPRLRPMTRDSCVRPANARRSFGQRSARPPRSCLTRPAHHPHRQSPRRQSHHRQCRRRHPRPHLVCPAAEARTRVSSRPPHRRLCHLSRGAHKLPLRS
jgi:hypothetical protein